MTKTKKSDRKAAKCKDTIDATNKSGHKAELANGSPTSKTIVVDRRASKDRRSHTDRRVANVPVAIERRKLERRAKVSRRRQIDPTTCERDYTSEEIQFMTAMDEYKRLSGRMFPTCSEILEVIRKLGYERRVALDPSPASEQPVESADPATKPSLAVAELS